MLRVKNVSYAYENNFVLNDVNFLVKKGEHVALIGESGSGKSTLLKAIYGLIDLPNGTIFWKANQVLGPAYHLVPGMDFMKYLAQDFDLMPYISVAENVGRFLSNINQKEKKERVSVLLDVVGMTAFANTHARYLSGGQMQRVALARVLALEPEMLLLDEPFSHIDFHLKNKLAQKVFTYCKSKQITILYTSHTPDEILMFSDKVIVMQNGTIVEENTPELIYHLPSVEYTAQLTGDVNLIPVRYFGIQNNEVLLVRPEHLIVSVDGINAVVIGSYFKGFYYLIKVKVDNNVFTLFHKESLPINSQIKFTLKKAVS